MKILLDQKRLLITISIILSTATATSVPVWYYMDRASVINNRTISDLQIQLNKITEARKKDNEVAAIVNGENIYKKDYDKFVSSLTTYYVTVQKLDLSSKDGKKKVSDTKIEALDQMINNVIIAQEAKKVNIVLTDEDINTEYDKLSDGSGGNASMEKTLMDYYGFTKEEFIEYTFRASLLKKKLISKLADSGEFVSQELKEKASNVLKEARSGKDFSQLAKTYSEDTSSASGGDLGWISKGQMVQKFEDAVFILNINDISGIVTTEYGLHIIKVIDKKSDQVKAAHILFKLKSFDDWVKEKRQQSVIETFI